MPRKTADQRHLKTPQDRKSYTDAETALLDRVLAQNHPTRMRIIRYLYLYGPANVGTLAGALKIAPGSISHHCKPLHQEGYIEPCPDHARDTRESVWKIREAGMSWNSADFPSGSRGQALAQLASCASEKFVHEAKMQWLQSDEAPSAWRDVSEFTQYPVHATADEAADLAAALHTAFNAWNKQRGQTAGQADSRTAEPTSTTTSNPTDKTAPDTGRMVLVSWSIHPTQP